MVNILGSGGIDSRTLSEFLNTEHEFISRFPKALAIPIGSLLAENSLYLAHAAKYRQLASAFKSGGRDELLGVLTSYRYEGEDPDAAHREYAEALDGLTSAALATMGNECERKAATLEDSIIVDTIRKWRVYFTGADGKYIDSMVNVATNAPPGGIGPAEHNTQGRNGTNGNGGNVVIVNSQERKQQESKGWKGLGD